MRDRFKISLLASAMSALLMLAATPVAVSASVVGLAVAGDFGHSSMPVMPPAHGDSIHQACTSPDCAPDPDCPANMPASECDMNGISCAQCGSTMSVHWTGELGLHNGAVVTTIQDPADLVLTTRSTSIFHPPRLAF